MLGRQGDSENPHASRLVASKVEGPSWNSQCLSKSSVNSTALQYHSHTRNSKRTVQIEDNRLGYSSDNGNHSSDNKNHTSNSQPFTTDSKSELDRRKKRESTEEVTTEKQLLQQAKRPRSDAVSGKNDIFCKSVIHKHI